MCAQDLLISIKAGLAADLCDLIIIKSHTKTTIRSLDNYFFPSQHFYVSRRLFPLPW